MAELVNQRVEGMINELEQMRRTSLYEDEEIREISRKRKEFEYKTQRKIKNKEDYAQYIAYELALLEDISLRRRQNKLEEKKKDIEYAIAKRLNKLFKQFIYRFQNDVEVYFEYIKFCRAVGFDYAISGIIGQMLQFHGDKPKMWQMAAKWESAEQNNYEVARSFLLKGIHRHPESDILYLDLFEIELMLAFAKTDEDQEEKENQLKRAGIVWRNGAKNVEDVTFLFKLYELSMKYDVESVTKEIQEEIWKKRNLKEVWSFVAAKELQGIHWQQIQEYVDEMDNEIGVPEAINNFIGICEEALQQFPEQNLLTKFIHELLRVNEDICNSAQKIKAVKHLWKYGHENGLLSNEMYQFGIEMLKLENKTSEEELVEILDSAAKHNPQARYIWEEKIRHCKQDEKKTLSVVQEACKKLTPDDVLFLLNFVLDNTDSKSMIQNFYNRFRSCESVSLLAIKPKLLQKVYDHNGLSAARSLYDELIRTPPTQLDVHIVMIKIESDQEKQSMKHVRKCYEGAVQHHGSNNVQLWMDYLKFETESGNAKDAPAIYRRAVGMLKKELVDEFIKQQTLLKLK